LDFKAAVEWSCRRYRDKVAITTPTISRTYGEIDSRSNALANALVDLGVRKGDRVGICVGNQIEYVEAEWAVLKVGAVRVPMLSSASVDELGYYIDFADVEWVFASQEPRDALRGLKKDLESRGKRLSIIEIGASPDAELDYETLLSSAPDTALPNDLTKDDLYAIRFTGGTTGRPKGIAMSHRTVMGMVNNMLLALDPHEDDVFCHFHPLSHAAGMLLQTWWMRGARQVILPAFDFRPDPLLDVVEREGVTCLFTIPTALNVILDSPELRQRDTSTLRQIFYGGAPIAPSRITEALDAFGPILCQVYGHSESPMVLSVLDPQDHVFEGAPPARIASAGRQVYNVDVRIIDAEGRDCEAGEPGEIISRGDNAFVGYWKNDELTAQRRLEGGWIRSGDIGCWDEDGYLHLVDRLDDMIITGGFNVWPAEVETVVAAHPGVAEAVVVGMPDDHWGEAVTAVVIARPGARVDPDELRTFAKERLPGYKVPKAVHVLDHALPKSPVGKLLRRAVRDELTAMHSQEAK
jgi:acyl-CoA synthetase (AMP-forming)/AMP-acid ligase II